MGFASPMGLWGLLLLIPFILIYLFKPKPLQKTIPSLMFFMKEQRQRKKLSFLRRLLTDLIFLLQLLALLALIFALAEPFVMVSKNAAAGNTVLIIDGSASMQASYQGSTRFEHALAQARDAMHGRISIIRATSNPTILVENGLRTDALATLATMQAAEAGTNIKGAMDLADSILTAEKGNVVVLSDFRFTAETDDPLVSKRLLNARGNSVQLVPLVSEADNVGFVDLLPGREYTEATLKNFNDEEVTVKVSVKKEGETKKTIDVTIPAKTRQSVVVDTFPGETTIEITPSDDLPADNIVYLSSPIKDTFTILLISNNVPGSIKDAIDASPSMALTLAEPPIIPDLAADIVIVANVNQKDLLPGTFNDLKRYVEKGGHLIVAAQDDLAQLDSIGILPVTIRGTSNTTHVVTVAHTALTKDIEFGLVRKHLLADAKEGAVTFLAAEQGSPLLVADRLGAGTVMYYGLSDQEADFKFSPDYPIFWSNLINYVMNTENIADYNFKLSASLQQDAGFVEENGKTVAYNLLDEQESDVSGSPKDILDQDAELIEKDVVEEVPVDLTTALLILAGLCILAELILLKYRGDA